MWTSSARDSRKFQGACVATGAHHCVIGRKQAKAYCKSRGCKIKLLKSNPDFRFGDASFRSMGPLPVRIPTLDSSFIEHKFYVVDAEIPMLLGLDLLDLAGIYANNVKNVIFNQKLD